MPKINTYINLRRPVLHDACMCGLLLLASRAEVLGMYPFGAAFFAACFDKSIAYMGLFFICMGLLSVQAPVYIMKYLISALLFCFFIHFNKSKSAKYDAAVCTCSAFLGAVIHSLCFGNGFFGIISSLIEAVLSGIIYIVFIRSSEFMRQRSSRTNIARDELISVALTAGICITGLNGIEPVSGVTLSGIAAAYTVMCISYNCSLSSAGAAGVGLGFVSSMSGTYCVSSGGFYGICSLFGSMLKGFGKYGCAVGFLGGAAAALIYSKFGAELAINPFDIVIAAVAFTSTPNKIHSKINAFFTKTLNTDALNTSERVRRYLQNRISLLSNAFASLDEVFRDVSDKRIKQAEIDAAMLFDETAGRVCRGCSTAMHCWERDFNSTYKRMLALLDAVEKDEEVPKTFVNGCVRSSEFVNEFYHIYEKYRERELFYGEAIQSRNIASEQYRDISAMLSEVAKSLENKITFRTDIEETIITELDKAGILLFEVSVIEIGENLFEVYLGLSGGAYVDKLEEIISEVTGTIVELDSERNGIAKFITKPVLSVSTGMCAVPCDGCEVSGDNAEIFETNDCKTVVILSDGMGCGYDARSESAGVIRLIKEFILAGFDEETAIKTVNSALCLQFSKERTATIDILCIDRALCVAKLYKIGCAETVFIHDDKYETILPLSLPVGMVDEISVKRQVRRIHSGDIFIMATDGVTQCGGVFEEWVKNEIEDEPDKCAAKIVDKAVSKWNGAAFDDLTVVAVRIE